MQLTPLLDERITALQTACEDSYTARGTIYATQTRKPCERRIGRTYIKLVFDGSVFAFIDKDGNVYKPASHKAPQCNKDGKPDVRYCLLNDSSYKEAISRCDWAGGFLYIR
jgi:hypothetical protein